MNQPANATTVTIIGAGPGGIALVANLGLLCGLKPSRGASLTRR
jgi:NADH dehydrogenase FAD-containing subunit